MRTGFLMVFQAEYELSWNPVLISLTPLVRYWGLLNCKCYSAEYFGSTNECLKCEIVFLVL